MIPAAACLLRLDSKNSLFILLRDRLQHASPNSGHTEAAVAGALGVQLGGTNLYFGKVVIKPAIGDAARPVEPHDILRANRLMLLSSALTLLAFLALRHQCLALLTYFTP
jgi:adenosylcobinamide-phosphate synthase